MRFPHSREQLLVWFERQIGRLRRECEWKKRSRDSTLSGVEADLKFAEIQATWLRHQLGLPLDRHPQHDLQPGQ
jgi:hypothetical protein